MFVVTHLAYLCFSFFLLISHRMIVLFKHLARTDVGYASI